MILLLEETDLADMIEEIEDSEEASEIEEEREEMMTDLDQRTKFMFDSVRRLEWTHLRISLEHLESLKSSQCLDTIAL